MGSGDEISGCISVSSGGVVGSGGSVHDRRVRHQRRSVRQWEVRRHPFLIWEVRRHAPEGRPPLAVGLRHPLLDAMVHLPHVVVHLLRVVVHL